MWGLSTIYYGVKYTIFNKFLQVSYINSFDITPFVNVLSVIIYSKCYLSFTSNNLSRFIKKNCKF